MSKLPGAMITRLMCIAMLLPFSASSSEQIVVGQTFLAGSTNATQGSTAWALTSHGIAEKLFTVNQDGNIVPQVAKSVTKVSNSKWEVMLKSGYRFSDGTALTAQHVADALKELNTVNSNAKASVGTMTITTLDCLKLTIVSERATPVMDAVLAEWVFVVYKIKDGNFIFTGPYAVGNFVHGDKIDLVPNQYYPRAADRPSVQIKKYANGASLASALSAGRVGMAFHLPVDKLSALRQVSGVTIKSFEVGYHYMMFHNIRKPQLSDVRVRRAVDIAIDRSALSQQLLGGNPTRSLFPDYTPYFFNVGQLPANKSGAEALLDEAGWVKDVDGKRKKNGATLTLDVVAYPQRPGLVLMLPLIAASLTNLGITVTQTVTDGSSWTQLDKIIADKSFDLMLWAQNTLPAGDPQWFLNVFFRSSGGSNHAGLHSAQVDSLLDALASTHHASRVTATKAAHTAILAEVPVSNLVTPFWHVGLNRRLSSYIPWGSDYYLIRADFGMKPVVVGQTFIAGSTIPTQGSTAWALTSHGIAEKLFTVNQAGEIVGQLAESVTKVDTLKWEVSLKAGYSFSDGTPVTAQDIATCLTELNTVNSNAKASVGNMTITALDGLKLRIETQMSGPPMDAVLAEWVFVVYKKMGGGAHFVFTGPYAVGTFVQGQRFDLTPNAYYTRAVERNVLQIKKYASGQLLASALSAGQVDMAFHLPVDKLSALRQVSGVTIKSFEVGYHYMMFHNIRKPQLSDVRVRRAVDIAIDRSALSQQLLGGNPTRSLFPDYTPYFSDTSQPHADKSGAEALLDAAGWVKDVGGKRKKNGTILTLDVVAYPQRPGLVLMLPLIAASLTNLGITVTQTVTDGSSWTQLDKIIADKSFDLMLWAQNTLPAGDPQWFLNAFFRSNGGSNHAGLHSAQVDSLLDALARTEGHTSRVTVTKDAQAEILAQVPVSNLVTPFWHVGFHGRLNTYTPWGSDYYVIRADFGLSSTTVTTTRTSTIQCLPTTHEASSASQASLGGISITSLLLLAARL